MPTKTEPTGSVKLLDDTGATVTATIYTTFTEFRPLSGPVEWIAGTKAYKMPDGSHLNPQSDGTFIEVKSSRVLRPAT